MAVFLSAAHAAMFLNIGAGFSLQHWPGFLCSTGRVFSAPWAGFSLHHRPGFFLFCLTRPGFLFRRGDGGKITNPIDVTAAAIIARSLSSCIDKSIRFSLETQVVAIPLETQVVAIPLSAIYASAFLVFLFVLFFLRFCGFAAVLCV